jgi:phage gp46-like protein
MVALTITPLADAGVELLPPDIVWQNGTVGDFALVTSADQGPAGGLQGQHPIKTAVLMCLYTDARCEVRELKLGLGGDRRGWPGDGFDIDSASGEAPLGSKFWLYRRHELTDITAAQIEAEAQRALQPLLDQQVVVRIDTTTEVDKAAGRISLGVNLYGRDGRKVYAAQFDPLWRTATPF